MTLYMGKPDIFRLKSILGMNLRSVEVIEISLIFVLLCLPAASAQADWSGIWDTTYGQMELKQSNGAVVGTYEHDGGRIRGQVLGERMIGTWSEDLSHAPPDGAGDVELNISADGKSFSGRWRYGFSEPWRSPWSGTRVSGPTKITKSTSPLRFETGICERDRFLGIVEKGEFRILSPYSSLGPVRLTGIPMQAAMSPEVEELDLAEYEGCAIMVCGHDGGGWIYSTKVIDGAGPILTAVVLEVFDQEE